MKFLKKIFSIKKPVKTFSEQIKEEIFRCEQAIFLYEKDIHNIKNLAADLFHKTLNVPKKYWYEELSFLEEILNLPENTNIDQNTKNEIKNIATSYKHQLETRKIKIEICRKNRDEFKKMLKKENILREKIQKEIQKSQQTIEKHKNIAQNLSNLDIENEISTSNKIEELKKDIKNLQEQLETKKEFNKQLEILYAKYGKNSDLYSNKIYIEELKKLIK
jgi:chromosome segregation ATPase